VNSTQLLRAVPLFDGFSNDDLVALSHSMHTRAFKAGQAIFAQGDSGRTMYIIERGRVDIHLPGDADGAILLRNLGLGEFFGELSLFDDKPRSASAIAATDAVLLELEHESLEKYFEIRPHAAIALLRAVSGYVRRTNALLSTRAATNVDEEFARSMTWSDRLADVVAELNGSWKFILLIILITAAWCLVNSNLMVNSPPDPYPYQFFNLALLCGNTQTRDVERQICKADHFRTGIRGIFNSAKYHADARNQFLRAEWLGHVIVRAKLEADEFICFFGARRQHNDRRVGGFAKLAGKVQPIKLRQAKVQNNHIWFLSLRKR